jgi:hypothetical protein
MALANFVFTETSPAAASTVVSSQPVQNAANSLPAGICGPMQDYDAVDVIAEISGATGGTLDVYLQISPDAAQSWYDLIHFAQAGAGSGVKYYQCPISNATNTTAPVQVGKGLSPVLGAGSAAVVNGAFSDRMRLVFVAGSGTTAGVQVIVRVAPQGSESVKRD